MNPIMRRAMQQALGHKLDPDNLCVRCDGWGMPRETRTQMRRVGGKLTTTSLGSGCRVCKGLGVVR